jgi:hypothetical protein
MRVSVVLIQRQPLATVPARLLVVQDGSVACRDFARAWVSGGTPACVVRPAHPAALIGEVHATLYLARRGDVLSGVGSCSCFTPAAVVRGTPPAG